MQPRALQSCLRSGIADRAEQLGPCPAGVRPPGPAVDAALITPGFDALESFTGTDDHTGYAVGVAPDERRFPETAHVQDIAYSVR